MQADRFSLNKAWERIQKSGAKELELQKWQARADASAAIRQKRLESLPQLEYDPELPITGHREQLVELLKTRQVVVVCGETGSGKSTQLPKICLEAGLGIAGTIGHTQPRRLAARAVASRLADELHTQVGELVGYKIRFNDQTRSNTLVKLMTDGVLLAETQSDRFLDQYDAIIIDEAHERSLNIDFLMGFLRQLTVRRPDLRLVITSATIDPQRFADHFADEQGPAPIVEVSGRTYPVEVRYRPIQSENESFEDSAMLRGVTDAVEELFAEGPGDILTFLPTERDIRATAKHLRGHFTRIGTDKAIEILPLYARLSQAEQNKIFAGHTKRRIVLATNVAESSLTVPGIHYVIDTGLVRISRYAHRSKVQRLPIEDISQASANQRSGRCGRLGPGTCIRLFAEDDFERRPKFTTPEIRRSDLASVLLQSMVLRLGPIGEFPLLDPPSTEAIRDGERTLLELGAMDENGRLNKIGRQLGALPCDPRVGRMLIEANERGCLSEVLIIAAAIECQDVRQRPAGQRPQADEAHQTFQDPHSDFLSYIRLWDFYDKLRSDLGRSRLQRALNQKFLSYQGFREWADVVRQLKELLAGARLRVGKRMLNLDKIDPALFEKDAPKRGGGPRKPNKSTVEEKALAKLKRPEGYAAIHQSLLTGLLGGIAQKGDKHEYKAARGLTVSLWPGSGLFRRQPRWIVAAEIVETNRQYARTAAEVDVEWVETAAASLLKHSYSDPHWSSKTGSAMVYKRSTLYGLPIVAGKRVPLAPIDRETSRRLLIEHGLVAGEWRCNEKFYVHNQELLADMHELAQRTRSREFILDRFHLANFYNQHLPLEVYDLTSLRSWLKKHSGSAAEQPLWMKPEDLLPPSVPVEAVGEQFPNVIDVGATALPLEYHFEPGHEADGVTLTVPSAALRQLSEEFLGWLVPGLLEEKILYLIKSLPKSLRTCFVPAPDVAKKLANQLADVPKDRAFTSELCAAMKAHAVEPVTASDFEMEKLPPHLRFLIRVVDDDGNPVEESRDLVHLQDSYAGCGPAVGLDQPEASDWTNRKVTPQDFDSVPEQVMIRKGGLTVAAFPALVDLGQEVELRLIDTQQDAERVSRLGSVRLFSLKHNRSLRSQVAHLPAIEQCSMKLAHLVPVNLLRSQLQDLVVRIALVEGQPIVRERDEFEARNARATSAISIAAQEISSWLPKLADEVHELRLRVEKAPAPWKEVFDEIAEQTQHLFVEEFLRTVPWNALAEYPRYLKAIGMRIDKLKSGGLPKDRKLREPIEQAWQEYLSLCKTNLPVTKLEQLHWMLEEFRVSVFAQTLGTKQTVSAKRVREFLDSLA